MGFGPGFGRGRGMHLRRRRFWGNDPDVVAPAYPQGPDYPEAGEAELLRREAQYMEASLEQIKKRLSQLEKQAQTDKTDKEKE
jgi:hypothetical protein